eukprot:scaffold7924_cov267-Pinguiococcus_pyrenoidosus.AAC.5
MVSVSACIQKFGISEGTAKGKACVRCSPSGRRPFLQLSRPSLAVVHGGLLAGFHTSVDLLQRAVVYELEEEQPRGAVHHPFPSASKRRGERSRVGLALLAFHAAT